MNGICLDRATGGFDAMHYFLIVQRGVARVRAAPRRQLEGMMALPVALVTGGARRIGRAIAEDLARAGWRVVVHARESGGQADDVLRSIAAAGGQAAAIHGDLANAETALTLFETASAPFGAPSIVVNNASVFLDDNAHAPDFDQLDRHFALHLKAPWALSAALAARGEAGLVVNIIDQRVWAPNPRFFSYSLSKAALWNATQMMAQAFAPAVRVNAIGPGPTLPSPRQDPAEFRRQVDALLLQRGPDLGEFGATIRYLWEAKSVTGQMIALDGGQHLAWQTPDIADIRE
jgi:NAD(P)-dependent dehydrogenase (short-subunit alcohol dehydrogenase family)